MAPGAGGADDGGFPYSIGQLVFHMNYWMDYELRRIMGKDRSIWSIVRKVFHRHLLSMPPHQIRKRLAVLLAEFGILAGSSPQEMQRQIESVHEADKKIAGTLEAVLCQMVAHNSYHTGQIAMIRQVLGAWAMRRRRCVVAS